MATTESERRKPRKSASRATLNAKPPTGGTPLLQSADVRTIVHDLAIRIAPADVSELMGHEAELRARAARFTSRRLSLLRNQLELALDCLRDHLDGACPHIPYHTVSLLAGALCYFSDELDVIPDFLPRVGRLDDAAVMAMACDIGAEGVRRYCAWKGRSTSTVLRGRTRRRPAAVPA